MKKSTCVLILLIACLEVLHSQRRRDAYEIEFYVHFVNPHHGSSVKVIAALDLNETAYGLSGESIVTVSSFSDTIIEPYGADLGWDSPVSQGGSNKYLPWGVIDFSVDFHNSHSMQFSIDFRDMKWTGEAGYSDTYLDVDSSSNTCLLRNASYGRTLQLDNNGQYSIADFWDVDPSPSTPTGLTITNTSAGPIYLLWNSNATPVMSYELSRWVTSGGSWSVISNPTTNAYTDNDYSWFPYGGNETIKYRLRAEDVFGRYSLDYTDIASCSGDPNFSPSKNDAKIGSIKIPSEYAFEKNYPNPFNPSTEFKYQLPKDSRVSLTLYDIIGRKISSPLNEIVEVGYHTARIDGSKLQSGIYLARFTANSVDGSMVFTQIRKIVFLK